jgi:hypothetical protein
MTDELDTVKAFTGGSFTLRASDAKALLKASGRTLTEMMQGGDMVEIAQLTAFLELRKRERAAQQNPVRGVYDYRDPAETWAIAEDIDVEFNAAPDEQPVRRPDPLSETFS